MNKIDLGLTESELACIIRILQQYIPDLEVRAFGSRVNQTAKKFSDLDLVIMSDTPLINECSALARAK